MKKDYSLIDIRLIELRSHYLLKIFISLLIAVVSFTIVYIIFSLPAFYDIFYKDTFYEAFSIIYNADSSLYKIINAFLFSIAILIIVLLVSIEYFVYNKRYQKIYTSIIFDELQLEDYEVKNQRYSIGIKTIDKIYSVNNISMEINEHICSLKKDNNFDIFQITTKGQIKYASLYVVTFEETLKDFIQFDTISNHRINEFNGKNVFDFYFDSPKFPNKINVFSSFGRKTNTICSKELFDKINKLQLYFNSKLSISLFENYIAIYVPNQKIKLGQPLIKRYKANIIEKKIVTIDYIYKSAKSIFDHITSKGGIILWK